MNTQAQMTDPVRIENLPNDIKIAFFDQSKKIAGDRWFVRICCVATLQLSSNNIFEEFDENDALIEAFKKKSINGLQLEVVKERNFIDEQAKDDITQQLIDQIYENSLNYIGKETFPHKFLLNKFEEFKKEHLARREIEVSEEIEEDDGPADFSACFRD